MSKYTNSVPAVYVGDIMESKNGGEFKYAADHDGKRIGLVHRCPGCKAVATLFFGESDVANGVHRWRWDGNEDSPTLQPSINHVDCWHGWLTAGRFVSC